MGRKTFSHPIKIVGTAATDNVLEVATSGDSQTAGTGVFEASGDLKTQNVGGQKIQLGPWTVTNILTNISGATGNMLLASIAGMSEIPAIRAGSVTGVGICLNAALTAGTLRINAMVNGSTVFSAVNAVTNVRTVYGTQNKDVDAVAAGDRLGCRYVTSAAYAPETLEGVAFIEVEE